MVSGNRPTEPNTKRLALLVQYDGGGFNGWQVQPEGRSVQSVLEDACGVFFGHRVPLVASGRTDTGVHALGQVVHMDTDKTYPLARICTGLNGILPKDISILNVYETAPDFNARFSACEREYLYRIYNAPQRSPFMMYRAAWVSCPIDIEFMNNVLSNLLGEHDFASFCRTSSAKEQKNTIRTIHEASVIRRNSMIEVTIRGNAFLHNMVRSIVGTVLEMSRKGIPAEQIKNILKEKDRRVAGETAPAYGLYLHKVRYDPSLESCPSAYPDYAGSGSTL